jgi:hypothetical protein
MGLVRTCLSTASPKIPQPDLADNFRRAAQLGKLDLAAVAFILLVGLLNLPIPFNGDQALFTLGAHAISQGQVLYRDFWDLKQPGIFAFYLVGGSAFGFTEIGIHTFEVIYMACFATVLAVCLKRYYEHPALAALAPVLTIGVYYAVAGSWHLTQVEGLVSLPMFLCLWFSSVPSRSGRYSSWRFLISGTMGGVVLLFKLMFLPLVAFFWLTAIIAAANRERAPARACCQVVLPTAFGLLCVLLPCAAYFAWHDALLVAYKTFFEYPPRLLRELPRSNSESFLRGLLWFARNCIGLMAFALVGFFLSLRKRPDPFTINLAAWCVLGMGVILSQVRSLWEYQYLLLLVPLGVLAVRGMDLLWTPIAGSLDARGQWQVGLTLMAALALLLARFPAAWMQKAAVLGHHGFAVREEERLAYQSDLSPRYREISVDAAFLKRPDSRPGAIYVCGSPVYYYQSGRSQAVALNGWALETYLPEQWDQLTRQLNERRPPYIFVDTGYETLIAERSPDMASFLKKSYRRISSSKLGVWYELSA